MRKTGRTAAEADRFEAYFEAQGLLGMPAPGAIDYSEVVTLDLDTVEPSLAGPKRPQDRVLLKNMKQQFNTLLPNPWQQTALAKTQPP